MEIVRFVVLLQSIKSRIVGWTNQLDHYRSSQKIFEKYRFTFSAEWLHFEHVQAEWTTLSIIFQRKLSQIQENHGKLTFSIFDNFFMGFSQD